MPQATSEKRRGKDTGATPKKEPPCEVGFILDAGALLAYLKGDEGGALVQRILEQCKDCSTKAGIAASDLLEVLAVSAREAPSLVEDVISLVDQLPLDIRPVTRDVAAAAAAYTSSKPELKPDQALGLSLAAQVQASGGQKPTLVTTDPGLADMPDCLYVGPRGGNPGA